MGKRRVLAFGLAVLVSFALASCSTTRLGSVWKDDSLRAGQFRKVLVLCEGDAPSDRKLLEDGFGEALKARGIETVPGYAVFPPGKSDRRIAASKMKELGIDAVLSTRMVAQWHVEPEYYTGRAARLYSNVPAYYQGWNNYYTQRPPFSLWPVHRFYKVYRFETTLRDTGTEKVVWSALSDTSAWEAFSPEIKSFVSVIMRKLARDGLVS
ncbi:MAG TPA: hypothetical protein VF790_02670 [Dissulfurispiraceae bacterium]